MNYKVKLIYSLILILILLNGCTNIIDINLNENSIYLNEDESIILNENKNIIENSIENKILLGEKDSYYEKYLNNHIKNLYVNQENDSYEMIEQGIYPNDYINDIDDNQYKSIYLYDSIHYGKTKEVFPITSDIVETRGYYKKDFEPQKNLEDYFILNDIYIDNNFDFQYKIKNYVNFFLDERTLNISIEEIKKIFIIKNNYINIFEKTFDDEIKVRIISIFNNITNNSLIKPRINLIQTIKDDKIISVTSIVPEGQTLEKIPFVISDSIAIDNNKDKYLIIFGYNLYDPVDIRTEIYFYKLISGESNDNKEDLFWTNDNIKLKQTFFKNNSVYNDENTDEENIKYYIDGISFNSIIFNTNVSSEGTGHKRLLYDTIYEIEEDKLFLLTSTEILLKDSEHFPQFILFEVL